MPAKWNNGLQHSQDCSGMFARGWLNANDIVLGMEALKELTAP